MITKFLVDVFGADSPFEMLKGVCMAKRENPDIQVELVGNRKKIFEICKKNNLDIGKIVINDSETEITNEDNPKEIIKSKKNSSMAIGLMLLSQKKADVFVSSGNSGALLIGTGLIVKKAPNIRRIAFATYIPKFDGSFLFLDSGANAQCTPEILNEFANMASRYATEVNKIKNPKVGILNIGVEEHKGDELRKETFRLLKYNQNIKFIGNVEPNSAFFGDCDILISDGFCGNIFLKTIEGMVRVYMKLLDYNKNFSESTKHVYLNPKRFAEESYSVLMGANLPVIKLHSAVSYNGLARFLCCYNKN